jgi:membrane-associated phospholipid phosphatase
LLIGRWRPKAFFDASTDAFSGGVLESFHGLLPLASLGYRGQSVPSGHTATAIALGIVLCRRWPHARWAFITLVSMSIVQRLAYGHHYPSDCLWGAALACTVTAVCYHPQWVGQYFDRFESKTIAEISQKNPPELVPIPVGRSAAKVVTEL